MSKSCDSLHLNCVALVERVVENTWRVNDLPAGVLVVSVTDEQVLCRESVWLHINVGIRDIVDEARFTDVGETADNESSRVSIDRWQSAEMLSYFFQITQRALQFLEKGAGATKSCALQLLCAIERVGVF